MLEKIFITGTDTNLISQLGNNKTNLNVNSSFFHSVANNATKTTHISHLGTYSAPLVCAYATTHLSYISTILICLRIPKIPSIDTDNNKAIENSFHTEWYFTIDLLRHCILLLKQNTNYTHNENYTPHIRNKIFILIPSVSKSKLNDTQLAYYSSIRMAIIALIKKVHLPIDLKLVHFTSDYATPDFAEKILTFIEKIHNKKTHRKIFSQTSWYSQLLKKISRY